MVEMTLIFHFLSFRFASQGLDEVQVECSMDAAALVFEP